MREHNDHHTGTLSPEMALLGQLFAQPGHGYDLHRTVNNDLGEVWHLSQSQAYAILKRLEKQGDIISEDIPQEKLPTRQLFKITPQGSSRFVNWLNAPSGGSTRIIRMEFITKLFFLSQYYPKKIGQAFGSQKDDVRKNILRLEKTRSALPAEQLFNRMSLDMRIRQLYNVLAWLDDYESLFHQEVT